MLLGDKVEPLVARSFGLQDALAGYSVPIPREGGEIAGYADIEYLWWAQIVSWWRNIVTVGFVSYSRYLERNDNFSLGLLLVSRSLRKLQFWGKQPFRSIELPTKEDQVSSVLRCMNLLEPEAPIVPGNEPYPRIELLVSTLNGDREITYSGGPMQDSSWINLREALFVYVATLNELYDDPEIREALDPKNLRISLE